MICILVKFLLMLVAPLLFTAGLYLVWGVPLWTPMGDWFTSKFKFWQTVLLMVGNVVVVTEISSLFPC